MKFYTQRKVFLLWYDFNFVIIKQSFIIFLLINGILSHKNCLVYIYIYIKNIFEKYFSMR